MKKLFTVILFAFFVISSCQNNEEIITEEVKTEEFYMINDFNGKSLIFYQVQKNFYKEVKANEYLKSKLAIPLLKFNCESGNYRYYLDTTNWAWFELDKTELTLRRVGPEVVNNACG